MLVISRLVLVRIYFFNFRQKFFIQNISHYYLDTCEHFILNEQVFNKGNYYVYVFNGI